MQDSRLYVPRSELEAFSRKLPTMPPYPGVLARPPSYDPWDYGEMDVKDFLCTSPRTLRKQRRLANRAKRKSRKAGRK